MTVTFTSADFLAILPVSIICLFGIYLMLQGVLAPRLRKVTLAYIGLFGVMIALVSNIYLLNTSLTGMQHSLSAFSGMLSLDRLSIMFNFIFLITAGLSLLMMTSYSEQEPVEFIEFTPLLFFATAGMMLMGSAESLIVTFLGLETMSIALYVMAGFRRHDRRSLEAALKYFLLGAFATGFLLYGMALVYGTVGSLNIEAMKNYFVQFTSPSAELSIMTLFGMGLILVGLGFKVALVPFHMWTPDVYQGAPVPVTAYMAVGAKAAGFAAMLRVFTYAAASVGYEWADLLWLLAVLTMTVGNIIALVQDDIKRMLAYSSIAHAGYILMGVVASDYAVSVSSVVFYLIAYLFMNLGAFGVVSVVCGKDERNVKIKNFAGLGKTNGMLALAMAVCMLSLAGFPPTGGFMGKLYLFRAAMQSGFLWLVIFGAINTLLSVYYYIRVVMAMYFQAPDENQTAIKVLPGVGLVILVALLGIFYLGLFPEATLSLIY